MEGHTDTLGSSESNLILSEKRATNVLNYLVDKGVEKERLTSLGFGETRPLSTNKTLAGRAKNRRVEFVIFKQ